MEERCRKMSFFKEKRDVSKVPEGEKKRNQIIEVPREKVPGENSGFAKLENKRSSFGKTENRMENSEKSKIQDFKNKYKVNNPENADNKGKLNPDKKKSAEDTTIGQKERAVYNKEEKLREKSNNRKQEEMVR